MSATRDTVTPSDSDALRPGHLTDFHGQPNVVRELDIVLDSARRRNSVPDHLLFSGPPGLGKTSLAHIVAADMGLPLFTTSGPALDTPADVVNLFSGLTGRCVVFIDEIHRMKHSIEEICYPAMEDRHLHFILGEGANARAVTLPLPEFTLIGATTQAGLLSAPLRDRFGFIGRLELYTDTDLAGIVSRSATLLHLDLTADAAALIAARSRGTPRVANTWLRRVRDVAEVTEASVIDGALAEHALTTFGVDALGLDRFARSMLTALCTQFRGGPVGVSTLAASVGETPTTLEEVYEPYLMRRGLIMRTPRGRVATDAAFTHLGLTPPTRAAGTIDASPALFDDLTDPHLTSA